MAISSAAAGGTSWGATLGAGGRGVMNRVAAGGLTLRRGDSSASSGPAKLISIAVVGLSGGEKEKGSVGPGKSCLCNRFIQPLADDYSVDHISVFSQSDFSGRVVNNDHFLYWGDVTKANEEGTDFHIQVVEQTEFYDDASFQPFRASGKSEPYVKRCTNSKLQSSEKLMYICKDQLGIEREYEQKLMPDGKFSVDGFLCVYDVSAVPNRIPEKQTEFCSQILLNIAKVKKPMIVVATKCDEANEILVRELERLINRKELKHLNIPVVEASAHENVNVDAAFFAVAQLVDRSRGRTRILSYYEAAMGRRQMMDEATDNYLRLLHIHITDYGVLWSTAVKKLGQFLEFQQYADLFGRDGAQRMFRRHVKKLKDDYLNSKVQRYFDVLPEVLHQLFPEFETFTEDDWYLVLERVRDHPDFNHFFVEYPGDTTWMEANLFDGDTTGDNRIPYEILSLPAAEVVFKNIVNQLHAHNHQLEMKKEFKKLLEDMGCVTPGKNLGEVKVLFLGRECFENLSDPEIQDIYDLHQREIILKAKKNFQELLLERADLFYQFRSSPAGTVTQDDILDITEKLQEDSRFKALDRLDADRKLMLFQHLGFVHCPIREHCHAFPNCIDSLVERIVAKKATTSSQTRPTSWASKSDKMFGDNNHLNLVILGNADLTGTLERQVKALCNTEDEFMHQDEVFSLDYRCVSGDVSLPENAFRTQDFLPHGCFCVYSDGPSFEYIRDSLEKELLSTLEQEDRLPFQGLPLVIVFAPTPNLPEKELLSLQEEGHNLAKSLQCPYLNVSSSPQDNGNGNNDKSSDGQGQDLVESQFFRMEEALKALIENIRNRSGLLKICKSNVTSGNSANNTEPDIRIIMSMLCGDPYSVENVLGPLLSHQQCYLSGDRSLTLETQFCDSKRKVEVILSSYHSAMDFRDELIHGFILVYSVKRRASLSTLTAFSLNIPELPIQLLAVSDDDFVNSDITSQLITEGNTLADRLNAHFMTSSTSIQQKSSFYTPFFKEVFEKKSEIEQAFSMEDAARLDDSGEGTLERPMMRGLVGHGQPMPPPRMDSYHRMRGSGSRSASGSEIYERLPADTGSLGEDLEDRLRISCSDEDVDCGDDIYLLNQRNGSEHLVKPSQLKHQHHHNKQRSSKGQRAPPPPDLDTIPTHPPRPSFFKGIPTSVSNSLGNSSSSSPPTTTGRGNPAAVRDSPKLTGIPPPPPPYKPSAAPRSAAGGGTANPAVPALPNFLRASDDKIGSANVAHSTFFQSRDSMVRSPPPEPAPHDPALMAFKSKSFQGNMIDRANFIHDDQCWVDDSVFTRRNQENDEEVWSNGGSGSHTGSGAFTTGRQRARPQPPAPPVKPRSQVPGKLNLNDFQKVSAALQSGGGKGSQQRPLTAAEDVDQHGYAVPKDTMGDSDLKHASEYAQPVDLQEPKPASRKPKHRERREQRTSHPGEDSDSESQSSSTEEGLSPHAGAGMVSRGQQKRPRKKPAPQVPRVGAIPVAMPKAPSVIPPRQLPPSTKMDPEYVLYYHSSSTSAESDHESATGASASANTRGQRRFVFSAKKSSQRGDFQQHPFEAISTPPSQVSPREEINFQSSQSGTGSNVKESEKHRKKQEKEMKQRAKEAERKKIKDEKRRLKEAEKEAKETRKKDNKLKSSNSIQVQPTLDDFRASAEDPIPLFLRKAITFIEREGLDAEGLYRVPGNRAHVELLFQKFDDDPKVDIDELDIAVNAVATAVKDFFFKRLPSILDPDHMAELETISLIPDRSIKVLELGKLIKRLPKTNFAVLKFIFQHFVKVTESSKDNCMDSKNLAICWWPTLLQYEFGDLGKFEAMRPHLEDIVQTMVDQYRFLFCGQEEVMMV